MNRESLALFDFDGTITSRDTLLEFVIYTRGWLKFCWGILLLSPVLFLYKAGVVPNWRAKEILLWYFLGGMSEEMFLVKCDVFLTGRLPALVREKAMEKIRDHIRQGHRVVVVSASPESWVGRWAEANGLECVATRLETADGRITGKISGKNCHGKEKVTRINGYLDLSAFREIYTYGDSRGDLPLLRLGTVMQYRPFRN